MAIRNNKLGGSDFVNGEVLYDYDLDDTFNETIEKNHVVESTVVTSTYPATCSLSLSASDISWKSKGLVHFFGHFELGPNRFGNVTYVLKKDGVEIDTFRVGQYVENGSTGGSGHSFNFPYILDDTSLDVEFTIEATNQGNTPSTTMKIVYMVM